MSLISLSVRTVSASSPVINLTTEVTTGATGWVTISIDWHSIHFETALLAVLFELYSSNAASTGASQCNLNRCLSPFRLRVVQINAKSRKKCDDSNHRCDKPNTDSGVYRRQTSPRGKCSRPLGREAYDHGLSAVKSMERHPVKTALGISVSVLALAYRRGGLATLEEENLLYQLKLHHPYTLGHVRRVGAYSELIAKELGLSGTDLKIAFRAGKMHDIGKCDIPTELLDGRNLTYEQFKTMKTHTTATLKHLNTVHYPPRFEKVPEFAAAHHELLDGSGYPKGLKGSQISRQTRIVSVADVMDAMLTHRSYHAEIPLGETLDFLKLRADKYDQVVVNAVSRIDPRKFLKVLESEPAPAARHKSA